MGPAAPRARAATARHVRVHAAEVSTQARSLLDYAEVLLLLVVLLALATASWNAMTPSEAADLRRPTATDEADLGVPATATPPEPSFEPLDALR